MNKFLSLSGILSCCILLAGALSSCDSPYEKAEAKFSNAMDLNAESFRLGLPLGAKSMHVGEEKFTNSRHCYFNSHHSAYEALLQGKIDGYLFDSHTLDYVASGSPDFAILPGAVGTVDIAIGLAPKNADLLEPINQFIAKYKKDGTYAQMYERWIAGAKKENTIGFEAPEIPAMPQIDAPAAPTRTLIVGTCSQLEPLCFHIPGTEETNANLSGFDIELLRRLALHLNVRYIIKDMDYITMERELAEGKLDIVIAGLNKTEERIKRQIIFSNNYIDSDIVVLVRSSQVAKEDK